MAVLVVSTNPAKLLLFNHPPNQQRLCDGTASSLCGRVTVSWILVLDSCPVIRYGFLGTALKRFSLSCSVTPVPSHTSPSDLDPLLSSSWSSSHGFQIDLRVSPLFSSLNSTRLTNVCFPTQRVNSKPSPEMILTTAQIGEV